MLGAWIAGEGSLTPEEIACGDVSRSLRTHVRAFCRAALFKLAAGPARPPLAKEVPLLMLDVWASGVSTLI